MERRADAGWGRGWDLAMLLVLGLAGSLLVPELGHPDLTGWDEVFHALVAKNMVAHPLEPTLFERPYLELGHEDWSLTRVWLHKGPLALWTAAGSFALLGPTPFALRLPSALLMLGAAWLTYLLGKRLAGPAVGLVAGTLQATNPMLFRLVLGYQFSDHVDIALLFWNELAVLLLLGAVRGGSRAGYGAAGLAGGMAFLAKSYPGLLVLGLGLVVHLADRAWGPGPARRAVEGRDLRSLAGGVALVALPWVGYCLVRFPGPFLREELGTFLHFNEVGGVWVAPWDRHLLGYLPEQLGDFYLPAWLGVGLWAVRAWRARAGEGLVLPAWVLGVLVPFSLAAAKSPAYLVLALPAFLLAVASGLAAAWQGGRAGSALLAGLGAAVYAVPLRDPAAGGAPRLFEAAGRGLAEALGGVFPSLAALPGLLPQLGLAGLAGGGTWLLVRLVAGPGRDGEPGPGARIAGLALALGLVGVAAGRSIDEALGWAWDPPTRGLARDWRAAGERLRDGLPPDAVLVWEDCGVLDHLRLMFHAERTVHSLEQLGRWRPGLSLPALVDALVAGGGRPYLLARRSPGGEGSPAVLALDRPRSLRVFELDAARRAGLRAGQGLDRLVGPRDEGRELHPDAQPFGGARWVDGAPGEGDLALPDGTRYRRLPGRAGWVDGILSDGGGRLVHGWSAAGDPARPADLVLVFLGEHLVGAEVVHEPRPDVAARVGRRAARAGFRCRVELPAAVPRSGVLRVFGVFEARRGFAELESGAVDLRVGDR